MSRAQLIVTIGLVATTACSAAAGEPVASEAGIKRCITGLAVINAPFDQTSTSWLGRHCPVQPGFSDYFDSELDYREKLIQLLTKSDLACNAKARDAALAASRESVFPTLLAECGREYYHLPAGQESLFSLEWYVADRIAAWLGRAHAAGGTRRLLLDLPDGAYEAAANARLLPTTAARAIEPNLPKAPALKETNAAVYVVIGDDLSLTLPTQLAIGRGRVEIIGAKRVPIGLGDILSKLVELERAVGAATRNARGILEGARSPALIAAGSRPARRVFEVVKALGRRAELAVDYPGAAAALELDGDAAKANAVLVRIGAAGCAKEIDGRALGAPACGADLAKAVRAARGKEARPMVLGLASNAVTVQELVDALSALGELGAFSVGVAL